MIKFVFDTNIFISAILTPGNPRKLVDLARERKVMLFTSEFIIWEIERILRTKINMETPQILVILSSIREISLFVSPAVVISIIDRDKSDNRILECAIEAKAEYIVSGDEHLLSLGRYDEISIVNASQFLKIYQSKTNTNVN
ncbi:MAG TPA: putative toxin-antitoxin system toxin component, PIN family [Candidatus Atribacteria bacterium]|nr:putative toxin-antitoxin system toxin component, PIN family [Candidatus Atribacteria bacterium]